MPAILLAAVLAHPHHATLAEAEYNAEARALEVALNVRPIDLERVLKRRTGKSVDIDSAAGEKAVAKYLAERFTALPPDLDPHDERDPEPAAFEWVGREFGVADGWAYFRLKLPGGIDGVRVTDRVLFDLEADQVNRLTLTVGRTRAGYAFDRDHPARVLRSADLKPIGPPVDAPD